jgi:aspartyl-tRNA(Asn)/glutamyl-tRNA(Gln) amidotransferase subunit B
MLLRRVKSTKFARMGEPVPYEVVIGLEVHAQLLTRTKLFCSDSTLFGLEPNTQVSPVSLGHPGTLPVMNKETIPMAIRLGLACHCEIVRNNYFARKNYFYPDLPKGYQISQHTTPICRNGFLDIRTSKGETRIRLNRIHMEEDAGKSIHTNSSEYTDLDYNRAGMPLLEIVTEPDIRSAEEASAYVTELRKIVRHLGVCDGDMEKGSLRCDVNISVRPQGDTKLGTKVEIKNLNSIRFIRKAVEFETERLIGLHRNGELISQETRGFDEQDFTTYSIRLKEDEDDYRYFPDPDLPPFHITEEQIESVRASMPPLPEAVSRKLQMEYGLGDYDAAQLAGDPELSGLFFSISGIFPQYKPVANWVIGPIRNLLASSEGEGLNISPEALAKLIELTAGNTISFGMASQRVLPALVASPDMDIESFVRSEGLMTESSDEGLEALVDAALARHAQKITEYKKGKKGLISLFVGEVMRSSKGKADAKLVTEKIIEKLKTS